MASFKSLSLIKISFSFCKYDEIKFKSSNNSDLIVSGKYTLIELIVSSVFSYIKFANFEKLKEFDSIFLSLFNISKDLFIFISSYIFLNQLSSGSKSKLFISSFIVSYDSGYIFLIKLINLFTSFSIL